MKSTLILSFTLISLAVAPTFGDVVSNFEDGFQGWTKVEPFNGYLYHEITGGNPGGYLCVYDIMAGGGALRISAPTRYLGNLSNCTEIRFDAYIYRDASQGEPEVTSRPRVFLCSGDTKYKHTCNAQPLREWHTQIVPLEDSAWTLVAGSKSFQEVLFDVDGLWLGMDMHWDWTTRYEMGADNITLVGIPNAYIMTFPNGGEKIISGSTVVISWVMAEIFLDSLIKYSTDSGNNWTEIDTVTGGVTSCIWTVPEETSDMCLVRVSNTDDTSYYCVSDNVFSIGALALDFPNGGEDLLTGSEYDIQWRSKPDIEYIQIEYSTNNGADWGIINPSAENNGIYDWYVWSSFSEECLVRISDANDPGIVDTSSGVFTIHGPLLLQSPNGGEDMMVGANYPIQWDSSEVIADEDIVIEYSANNGIDWTEVSPQNTGNPGTYDWLVPEIPSTHCLIRISLASDPEIYDTSNSVFAIRTLNLISPNGPDCLVSSKTHTIEWESSGTVSTVLIEYSVSVDGSWTEVSPPNTGNTGSYSWLIPFMNSIHCQVRISNAGNPDDFDVSDSVFKSFSLQPLRADFDLDSYITLADLQGFATCWLQRPPYDPTWCGTANLNNDPNVSFDDYGIFVKLWQKCGNPCDPSCNRIPGPVCWEWPYQCHGDADNKEDLGPWGITYPVGDSDADILNAAHGSRYPELEYDARADFDRDGDVDDDDIVRFLQYYRSPSVPEDCLLGGLWPPI